MPTNPEDDVSLAVAAANGALSVNRPSKANTPKRVQPKARPKSTKYDFNKKAVAFGDLPSSRKALIWEAAKEFAESASAVCHFSRSNHP